MRRITNYIAFKQCKDDYNSSSITDLCFMEAFLECVAARVTFKGNSNTFRHVYFMGHWNIDVLNCWDALNIQDFAILMTSNECIPLTTKPTAVTESSVTFRPIDHI